VPQLRLALAQIDPVVGDLAGNTELVLAGAGSAAGRGSHLVAFPEMALTGYPVEDLALRSSFVQASRNAVAELANRLAGEGLGDLLVIVGFLDGAPDAMPVLGTPRGAPQNAAALLHGGRVVGRYAKHHLPNYGVFDEYRYFVPGTSLTVARIHGIDVAVAICEDIWQDGGPVAVTREARADCSWSSTARRTNATRTTRVWSWCSGARHRPAARWPTSTWSAARTSWFSTATRSWWQPTARF
jgi:NAD+ synthase (glutamine-hydrolysing)